jgi:hypothetical protein
MSAVTSAVNNNWLTAEQENAVSGQVANPIYPGPVTTDHAGGPETVAGRTPVGGQGTNNPLTDDYDFEFQQVYDAYPEYPVTGHGGPVSPHDSNAYPNKLAGVNVDTHAIDTGGVERKSKVLMPKAVGWFRRTISGMTYDKNSYSYNSEGFMINTATGRQDLDQYQGKAGDAYDPFLVPYAERPVLANLAYESIPYGSVGNPYIPSGQLPNMTPTGGQGNNAYTSPDDPPVNTNTDLAPAPQLSSYSSGWF